MGSRNNRIKTYKCGRIDIRSNGRRYERDTNKWYRYNKHKRRKSINQEHTKRIGLQQQMLIQRNEGELPRQHLTNHSQKL